MLVIKEPNINTEVYNELFKNNDKFVLIPLPRIAASCLSKYCTKLCPSF